MKKIISRILIFFAVVFLIDMVFGCACRYLNCHAKGGDTKNQYYITKECEKDILIFGSSRANHHYAPKVIEDSLSMSCYNCGLEGNGIVLFYSRLLMMTNRYTPKILIYDIYDSFDVAEGDNMKYLQWQKRFYDEPGAKDVFTMVNPNEKYKMLCNLYRYNGNFIQMISDNYLPIHNVEYGGYRPVRVHMTDEPMVKDTNQITTWDPIKKECMTLLVQLCKEKDIQLIFAYSPSYGGYRPSCDNLIKEFVKEHNLLLLDHYSDMDFCMNKEYFYDTVHMNDTGATDYTKKICHILKMNHKVTSIN